MKNVVKLTVVTDKLPIEIITLLEQNGCRVGTCEVEDPSWEDLWEGFE